MNKTIIMHKITGISYIHDEDAIAFKLDNGAVITQYDCCHEWYNIESPCLEYTPVLDAENQILGFTEELVYLIEREDDIVEEITGIFIDEDIERF